MTMSITASISITFMHPVNSLKPLMVLLNSGWTYNYHGEIIYLPLHDNGMYDWRSAPCEDWQYVLDILQVKCDHGEIIGLGMSIHGEGATFNFDGKTHLDAILDADRKRLIEGQFFTDFSWHLKKIVSPLIAANFSIEAVECSDIP